MLSCSRVLLLFLLSQCVWFSVAWSAVPGPSSDGGLSAQIRQLESKVLELESIASPGKETKAVLDLYHSALARLQQAEEDEFAAARFRVAIEGAVKQREQVERDLQTLQKKAAAAPKLPSQNTSIEDLIQELDRVKAQRQAEERELQEQQAKLAAERLRPEQSARELSEATRLLEEAVLESAKGVGAVANAVGEAQRVLADATRQALTKKIDRLKLERLSHPPRLQLLRSQVDFAKAQLAYTTELEQALSERIQARRSAEADAVSRAAEKAQAQAQGKHDLLERVAVDNAALGRELTAVIGRSQRIEQESQRLSRHIRLTQQGLDRLQQQLAVEGLGDALGELLRLRRQELNEAEKVLGLEDWIRQELAAVRLALFKTGEQRVELQNAALITQRVEALRPLGIDDNDWQSLSRELVRAYEDRRQLYDQLLAAHSQNEKQLGDLSVRIKELESQVQLYRELLNRNLLWIPSTTLFSADVAAKVAPGFFRLFGWQEWVNGFSGISQRVLSHPWRVTVAVALIFLLLVSRRRMADALAAMAPKVGNVSQDSFLLTLRAFGITLMLALPWVLLVALLGVELLKSDSHTLGEAVLVGFRRALVVFLVFQALRYLLVPNGLAEVHFRWNRDVIRLFQRHLKWFVPFWMPTLFLVGMTEWLPEEDIHSSIGRLVFMLGLLGVGGFLHATLNPQSGAPSLLHGQPVPLLSRKGALYLLSMTLTLALLLLAYTGYFYTALRFERLVMLSALSAFAGFLFYSLTLRWLLVAERRLALMRARAKRQAAAEARAAKEAADAAGEGFPEMLDMDAVNLATINEQTRRLLRLGGLLVTALLLILTWWDLVPAFAWMDELVLWQHVSQGVEGDVLTQVSLFDVGLAVIALLLTLTAGKNLPGLLEITLLQALDVDQGTRFAASSFSRYLIYGAGSLWVLQLVGMDWDDVQWLVAAMGVGLGFGLKEIFANLFSGIMILFERPIRIGDIVTIGDVSGTVTRIRMRATTITDWDNKELLVPNQKFIVDPLVNWTLTDPVTRIVVKVGIAYGSDTEKALQIMSELVAEHPDVMKEPPPTVFFLGFGESSLDFEIRVFVRDRLVRLPLTHDLHMKLEKALREGGIEIPFPQRDLHIRSTVEGSGK